ncbi:MAG: ornithine carbamoyltransferase [Elusimicrobia bacterium]|nr:ornithine carbamoyltransferase [Elusimicrobiota bacterium]
MKSDLRGRDFISVMDFTKEELETILQVAIWLKMRNSVGDDQSDILKGKNLGMLFASPSTRTRLSFSSGITQLGGSSQIYNPQELQLKNKESWKDTGEMISRFLDGFAIRLYNLKAQMGADSYEYGDARKVLRSIAETARIPVINMLDDKEHPCQIMGDIMTMREKFGEDYKKKKVVMSWAYDDRAKSAGVPQTMIAAGCLMGMNITLCYPPVEGCYDVDPEYVAFAKKAAHENGGSFKISNDIWEASKGADVIYAKSWARMPEKHAELSIKYKKDYCISHKHFEKTNEGAVYMHCLPAKRNAEVTDALIDDPKISIVNDEAENRLHVQKAIMALTMC